MPVITQTTHNPRYEQQYNLELLRQLGGLASTAAGIYGGIRKDARADKKDAAALAREDKLRQEQKEFQINSTIMKDALTNGNYDVAKEYANKISGDIDTDTYIDSIKADRENKEEAKAKAKEWVLNSPSKDVAYSRALDVASKYPDTKFKDLTKTIDTKDYEKTKQVIHNNYLEFYHQSFKPKMLGKMEALQQNPEIPQEKKNEMMAEYDEVLKMA
ncbi:MAG: hypothetical protein ABIB11_02955, partial [Candidatus Omnitrophota bacterium]